ncbi:MAG: S-layer homology domain-containing protein, partial [Chloroflexota bacterium]|nr:S-layer homology domain-containing protein [Chloroflexota bacterium]
DNDVYALAVSGSTLYVGGHFSTAGGVAANHVAAWNGSTWAALGAGTDNDVLALAVSGTTLYAGGEFTTAGGAPANHVAAWNGSAWAALGAGTDNVVLALAVSGSTLYAGGHFYWAGGVATNNIAAWNGSAWAALGAGTDADVTALTVSGDTLYVGGHFTTAGGSPANHIAAWTGSAWAALGSGTDKDVYALAVSSTTLYAGGDFTTAGDQLSYRFGIWTQANALPCTVTFSDVQPSDYFYQPVQYLACHGVISGYADGTFRPGADTTRGQLSKIIMLAYQLAIQTPTGGDYTFADNLPGSPFFPYIETAAAHGIVSGYNCGGVNPQTGASEPCDPSGRPYYRPGNNVTRGQLSKIVVLTAAQIQGWALLNPPTARFHDVPPTSTFYPYIETAVCHRILSGYSDGNFRPTNNATRGQISKIVYLAITDTTTGCGP